MNVWHVYARYYNYGDHVLGIGVRRLFSKYFYDKLIFKPYDVHTLRFNEQIFNQMNSTADLLLVGGGGLIHGFAGDKWMFRMPDELIDNIKIPCIIFGVGYNQFNGEKVLDKKIIRNIKLLKNKCVGFSVRNDKSKNEMLKYGINLDEVADPGFFLDGDYPRPDIDGDYVLFQLANDMKLFRDFNDEQLLMDLKNVAKYIIGKGYKIVLAPHVRLDIELCNKLLEIIDEPDYVFMWNWFEAMKEENAYKSLAYYKYAKFVIAMRGHAQIIPIGMNTPVITIGSHRKNYDLLENLGIEKYYINANDVKLSEKVISMIEDLENNYSNIKKQYNSLMERMNILQGSYIKDLAKKVLK